MGAFVSYLLDGISAKARQANLPSNPLEWSDAHVKDAAEIMFNAYDKDQSGTISKEELTCLFHESGLSLANFGTKNLDFTAVLDSLVKKYDKDNSSELSYDEFFPLFKEMIGRMAEEGFIEKTALPKFEQAIEAAIAQTRILIVSLDYRYDKELELTGIVDGQRIEKMARNSAIQDVTALYDDQSFSNRNFPLKKNIKRQLQAVGRRCQPNDVFVFFFSGHGINVPDEDGDEADGEDEAFATPNKHGELDLDNVLVDDDFSRWLDRYIPKDTRILVITDCCHSGSICDIDSFNYKHQIIQISSAKDDQTSIDMATFGATGGVLTCAIGDCSREFSYAGKTKVSVADIYNDCVGRVAKVARSKKHCQDMGIQHANIQPHEFPWPFVCA